MMSMLTLRPEKPVDYRAVETLTREAFRRAGSEPCDQHLLVRKMRQVPAFIPELAIVAEVEGRIAGHIAYTRSTVVSPGGRVAWSLTFGPLSVKPEFQGRGIGAALVDYSLRKARAFGYLAVVILGDPRYFSRFGFRPAASFGLTLPGGMILDALMVLELQPAALEDICGHFFYDAVFEDLPPDEVAVLNAELGSE